MPVGCIPEKTIWCCVVTFCDFNCHTPSDPQGRRLVDVLDLTNPPPAEGDVPAADGLTEQEKVRITLKSNFVRFPTSSGSINIHASLESLYARLHPLS